MSLPKLNTWITLNWVFFSSRAQSQMALSSWPIKEVPSTHQTIS